MSNGTEASTAEAIAAPPAGIGFFEKRLTAWVALCIGAGLLLGNTPTYTEATLTIRALLSAAFIRIDSRNRKRPLIRIENRKAMEFPENRDIPIRDGQSRGPLKFGNVRRRAVFF
jgi:hypothetical protein